MMKKKSLMHYSNIIFLQTKVALILSSILKQFSARNDQKTDLSHIKKVLVLKTDEIGDFVLASAFLRELRLHFLNARITLVVNSAIYKLAELCPYVDKIIVYKQDIPRYLRPFVLPWRAFQLGYYTLRPEDFDIALVPRWDMNTDYSAYVAYFSSAKRRIGYTEHVNSRKQLVNKGFDLMLTDIISDEKSQHEVEKNLGLIRYLGGNPSSDFTELWINSEDENFADKMLAHLSTKRLIVFCPGAGKSNRQWPSDRFVELGKWLQTDYDASLIIVGGDEDKPVGECIHNKLNKGTIDCTGRTTLRQTAALLKRCHLYVGNDTGSMHMAAAMRVPIVEISCFPIDGPEWHWNSPCRFGPWQVPRRILQPGKMFFDSSDVFADEHLNHINEISVEQVKDAIRELLPEIIREGN